MAHLNEVVMLLADTCFQSQDDRVSHVNWSHLHIWRETAIAPEYEVGFERFRSVPAIFPNLKR